ncbi:MAG: hypothetical protein AAB425_03755 [Bdellovibrionota bacterium]
MPPHKTANNPPLPFRARIFLPSGGLYGWHLSTLQGPDASDFLHRISTADVRNLKPGEGASAFLLDERGKALACFYVWKRGPDSFLIEFDPGPLGEWQTSFHQRVERLTFSEKMTWSPVPGSIAWIFPDANLPETAALLLRETPQGIILNHGSRVFGRAWSTVIAAPNQTIQEESDAADPVDATTLDRWRLEALAWWPSREGRPGEFTPLELGAGDGVAGNKGCYPGQEVIEKMISLGAPPRRLVRLSLADGVSIPDGTPVTTEADSAPRVGTVSTCVEGQALAVLQKICAKPGSKLLVRPVAGQAVAATVTREMK